MSGNNHKASKRNPPNAKKNQHAWQDVWASSVFHKFILFSGALLLYGHTYRYGYGIDDKFILVPLNDLENNFSGFLSIFKIWFAGADYRPLSFLSFWLEKIVFDVSGPGVSHMVNVLLFGCILIKIYDLIIAAAFYEDEQRLKGLAILCGLLFLAHPNHVSVVANIKARDNLLSMLFGLFAAIELIRYFNTKKTGRMVSFIVFITCAFLSKLDSYIFILTPGLLRIVYGKFDRKSIIQTIAVSILLFIFAYMILEGFKTIPNQDEYIFSMGFDENPLIGHDSLLNRLSLSLTSLFYYFKFILIPNGYHFFFGYNQIPMTGLFSLINMSTLLLLSLLGYLSYKSFRRDRIYLFSFLFFLLAITYALNFFQPVAGIVMDKYDFIASLGFCLAIAALCIELTEKKSSLLRSLFIFLLIAFYVTFTISRTRDWKNSYTLIEKDMPALSQSVNANRMAAAAYINLALDEEMKPNNNRTYTDSLITKGERYAIQGLGVYEKVPDLWELRGLSSFYRKNYPEALQFFLKCKEADSSYLSGINYIGYTYWALGKTDSAYHYFKYVIDREPVFYYSANNMLNMLLQTNRKASADSLVTALKKRYPEDKWLKRRVLEIYGHE